MKIKKRVLPVTLSDGNTVVVVHSPTMEQFSEYLSSFAVITRISQAFQEVGKLKGGINANLAEVKLDKQTLEDFYPLLAVLSAETTVEGLATLKAEDLASLPSVSVEDYKQLQIQDGMAILLAYIQLLAPETLANPTNPEAASQTPPPELQPSAT